MFNGKNGSKIMIPLSNAEELLSAWRALAGSEINEGWRTIQILQDNFVPLLAGRHFPENEEALLIGFDSDHISRSTKLPEGQGFNVTRVDLEQNTADYTWIALCRQNNGNLELFSAMAVDVIESIERLRTNSSLIFHNFLSRIFAWQDFMRNNDREVLTFEKQIGLFGELVVLKETFHNKIPYLRALDSWKGPLRGIHDFAFDKFTIEVKTTVNQNDFLAKITSLEQLDDTLLNSLFLAGIRLKSAITGKSLPILINEIREILKKDHIALNLFNTNLIHAGFLDYNSDKYVNQFIVSEKKIYFVNEKFPRLIESNISKQIKKVHYEINLDEIECDNISLDEILNQTGV